MAGKKKDRDGRSWALIVILFLIGLWPAGLFFLFVKLFGNDRRKPPRQADGAGAAQAAPASEKNSGTMSAARRVVRSPGVKKSNARNLKVIGTILAIAGLAWARGPLDVLFRSGDWSGVWLWDLLQALAVSAGGVGMLCAGVSMDRAMKRYGKYLSVIGERGAVCVGELARTLGFSESRVERDIQKMLDKGYFGEQAYLNVELGCLFRDGQADADFRKAQAEKDPKPDSAEDGGEYGRILQDIRKANDAIADPVLSEKIHRLEEITRRIFRSVEADPRKKEKIGTLLSYYLPATQKLLDSYAQFEAVGIEGENLHRAKERIGRTMDAIVAGFEHQLDELYQADAMDVDSDIRVMESMLRRDTATVEQDFGLDGGAAVQEEE